MRALFFYFILFMGLPLAAQESESMRLGVAIIHGHRTLVDVTYLTANGYEAKLDVYPSTAAAPAPTVFYFHGGGWLGGNKDLSFLQTMPYLAMGWTVVNVEYRMGPVALAPAAVEDCRCAVRFVLDRAKDYNVDPKRIVLTGHSAGGHLALMTGMMPVSAGLDRQCAGTEEIRVAAIVNWYGITDVVDMLDGPNMKGYAVRWLGSQPDREGIARRVSPLTWVKSGTPPVLTIHGDADPVVPYQHAVRLAKALEQAGVKNELVTIPGGKHGGFSTEDQARAYTAIEAFLKRSGVLVQ
jgi:acetyl esterase/lipase